jgi:hypothetical protein
MGTHDRISSDLANSMHEAPNRVHRRGAFRNTTLSQDRWGYATGRSSSCHEKNPRTTSISKNTSPQWRTLVGEKLGHGPPSPERFNLNTSKIWPKNVTFWSDSVYWPAQVFGPRSAADGMLLFVELEIVLLLIYRTSCCQQHQRWTKMAPRKTCSFPWGSYIVVLQFHGMRLERI